MIKRFCKCGCGQEIEKYRSDGKLRLYVNGHNRRINMNSNKIPWDRLQENQGYLFFTHNYKRIYVHKYMMELYLGHTIPMGTIVHHKNGDKHDNRIENFELLTWAEHARTHYHEHQFDSKKQFC